MNGVRVADLGDIPFYVSPWFLALALYTGWGLANGDWALLALWVFCLTVSVVVHELGHALVARAFRLQPQVLLHGLGGLCAHNEAKRDRDEALIVAAGPAAGLALGGLSLGALLVLRSVRPEWTAHPLAGMGLNFMVWIGFVLNLLNLLPIWPLDGGQLFRLLMTRLFGPLRGEKITHVVGLALCAAAVVASFALGLGRLTLILGIILAWGNIQVLRGERRSGAVRARGTFARGLFKQASAAFAEQRWADALRLAHQIRSESAVPAPVLEKTWRILGLSSFHLGEHADAVSYLRRAPLDTEVGEALLRSLVATDAVGQARELVASREWQRLGRAGEDVVARVEADVTPED